MEDLIKALENINNPGVLDYINLTISILSFFVALVAIGLTVYTCKRQEKIAVYDSRKNIYKNVLKLQDFLCMLAIYENRLKSDDIKSVKGALQNIQHSEIDISVVYDLMEARFILPKKHKKIVVSITNGLVGIIRNYKMIKDFSYSDNLCDKEDIDELYNKVLPMMEDVKELIKILESHLQY